MYENYISGCSANTANLSWVTSVAICVHLFDLREVLCTFGGSRRFRRHKLKIAACATAHTTTNICIDFQIRRKWRDEMKRIRLALRQEISWYRMLYFESIRKVFWLEIHIFEVANIFITVRATWRTNLFYNENK